MIDGERVLWHKEGESWQVDKHKEPASAEQRLKELAIQLPAAA